MIFLVMPASIALGENSVPWKISIKVNSGVNGTSFWPQELHARQNETVQWINNDTTVHTITSGVLDHPSYTGKIFDSGTVNPGSSYSLKISDHMWSAYYYFCKIHPWMTGKIDVGTAYLGISPDFNIGTDKTQYSEGDWIRIAGIANNTYQITPVTIQIFDNQRNLVYIDKTNLLSDHSFFYEFKATNSIFKTNGDYKIKSFYGFPSTITDVDISFNDSQSKLPNTYHIPYWIKNNARWWSDGKISDKDFVTGIQFLINAGDITITKPNGPMINSNVIPIWIKSDAQEWANEKISNDEFASSIQYLIIHKIIIT
jgi:plastocyanin